MGQHKQSNEINKKISSQALIKELINRKALKIIGLSKRAIAFKYELSNDNSFVFCSKCHQIVQIGNYCTQCGSKLISQKEVLWWPR